LNPVICVDDQEIIKPFLENAILFGVCNQQSQKEQKEMLIMAKGQNLDLQLDKTKVFHLHALKIPCTKRISSCLRSFLLSDLFQCFSDVWEGEQAYRHCSVRLVRSLSASSTMSPAIHAFVVAMACMMLPAMPLASKRLCIGIPKECARRLAAAVTNSTAN
jgi:hypothetical protein